MQYIAWLILANRLGSSLDGAFAIWDPLLKQLATSQRNFLPVLVKCFLRALGDEAAVHPEQDPERDAQLMWLIHLFNSKEWAFVPAAVRRALRQQILKWSCVYPGNWVHMLGSTLVRNYAEGDIADLDTNQILQKSDAAVIEDAANDNVLEVMLCSFCGSILRF